MSEFNTAWVSDTGEYSGGSGLVVFNFDDLTSQEWHTLADLLDGKDRFIYARAILNKNYDLARYIEGLNK